MINKYEKLSPSSAPDWMICLEKSKHVEEANLDIRGYKFEFVWKPHLFSRDIQKHSFHILFYTEIGCIRTKFVAMDETNGNLYLIKYHEDYTESIDYSIEFSELLDEPRFVQIINEFNNRIPGIATKYGDFYNNNWHNYLEMKSKQSLIYQCLLISFDYEENRCFYILDDELSQKSNAYAFSCSKDVYLQWKEKNNHPLDDILERDSLITHSTFYYKKKLNIFNTKTIRKKFGQLYEISTKSSDGNANSGHFLLTKHGLLCWEKYGVPEEQIKQVADEIVCLLSK